MIMQILFIISFHYIIRLKLWIHRSVSPRFCFVLLLISQWNFWSTNQPYAWPSLHRGASLSRRRKHILLEGAASADPGDWAPEWVLGLPLSPLTAKAVLPHSGHPCPILPDESQGKKRGPEAAFPPSYHSPREGLAPASLLLLRSLFLSFEISCCF